MISRRSFGPRRLILFANSFNGFVIRLAAINASKMSARKKITISGMKFSLIFRKVVSYLSFGRAWTKSYDQNNWFVITKKSKQIKSE
jgi:hypothetical protein